MFLFLLKTEAELVFSVLICVCLSGGDGSSKVLAKDSQSKGSDVSERAGGDSGRHRALRVCQSDGAALQTAGQMRLQPTFPGLLTLTD